MADPIGGGLGKAAQQMMQQVQQQAVQQQKGPQQAGMEGNKFDKMMTQQVQDPSKVQDTQKAMDVLKTAKANQVNQVDPSLQVKQVEAVQDTKKGEGIKKVLAGVMDGQAQLDSIIAKASSGKQFSNQELLAMQAGVYKFSQELELTSKVVEKATSGVKQTMQTQV